MTKMNHFCVYAVLCTPCCTSADTQNSLFIMITYRYQDFAKKKKKRNDMGFTISYCFYHNI